MEIYSLCLLLATPFYSQDTYKLLDMYNFFKSLSAANQIIEPIIAVPNERDENNSVITTEKNLICELNMKEGKRNYNAAHF